MVTNPEVVLAMMEINHLDAEQFSTARGIVWGWDQAVCVLLWKGSGKDQLKRGTERRAGMQPTATKCV